jgi:hypothetical protein
VFLPVFVVAAVGFFTTSAGSSEWTIGGHRPASVDAEIQTAAALVGALSGFISAATGLLLAISKFTEIRQRRRSRAASRNAATVPQTGKAIGRSGDDRCPTCHGTGTVSGPDLGPYRQRGACIACMGTGWLHVTTANVEEVTTVIAANVEEVTTVIKVPRQSADEETRRLTGSSSEE